LEISFNFKGDKLICTVTDNGIGRKASMENKEENHHSLGMQITAERLENLNTKSNSGIKFEIADLHDESGNSLGTEVKIILPKNLT
jgi:nitrate/nitrite-specific signal transduction histidine kinase